MGQILSRSGLREKVFLATKLPQYLVRSRAAMDRYLAEQLRRLQTDHIDFYLLHMLSGKNSWERLVALGIQDWIREKKAEGSIRRIGFSFHGNTASFLELLDCYDWDFCQIQYNYMDETHPGGPPGSGGCPGQGHPRHHHGASAGRPADGGTAASGQGTTGGGGPGPLRCGVGPAVALESAGGHLRALGDELPGRWCRRTAALRTWPGPGR